MFSLDNAQLHCCWSVLLLSGHRHGESWPGCRGMERFLSEHQANTDGIVCDHRSAFTFTSELLLSIKFSMVSSENAAGMLGYGRNDEPWGKKWKQCIAVQIDFIWLVDI